MVVIDYLIIRHGFMPSLYIYSERDFRSFHYLYYSKNYKENQSGALRGMRAGRYGQTCLMGHALFLYINEKVRRKEA